MSWFQSCYSRSEFASQKRLSVLRSGHRRSGQPERRLRTIIP
ncbi:hypothetical protein RHECNPAF_280015 [Rhizobium etli CNPAF512]|nr:hypothetical protein RHECNPAF_280015 [Rhizobium etli CNPAF512]